MAVLTCEVEVLEVHNHFRSFHEEGSRSSEVALCACLEVVAHLPVKARGCRAACRWPLEADLVPLGPVLQSQVVLDHPLKPLEGGFVVEVVAE